MRLTAFIAAFGIIIYAGYWLVMVAYPHFLHTTGSQFVAEAMLLVCLAFASLSVLWAVKRLP